MSCDFENVCRSIFTDIKNVHTTLPNDKKQITLHCVLSVDILFLNMTVGNARILTVLISGWYHYFVLLSSIFPDSSAMNIHYFYILITE